MNPYEILIRFDENGNYKGGHTIRFDPVTQQVQEPQPIGTDKAFPWPDEVKAINQSIAARVSELENLLNEGNAQRLAIQAEKEAVEKACLQAVAAAEKALSDYKAQAIAVATAISAAVNDPKTDTDSAVTAILQEATKDERTKQREAKLAQIATLQAEADSLK